MRNLKFHPQIKSSLGFNSRRGMENGQALIVVALAILGLVGMVSLVIDGGNAFQDRRKAQNAADSAALAASLSRIRGERNFASAALKVAEQNGYNNDGTTNKVEVHSPPISGPNAGDFEYIQVIIVSRLKTYIASAVGWREITNTVNAVSRTKTPEIRELLNGMAVVSLAPTSNCTNNRSFWVHGEATLDVSGGGVFVNSNNTDCALIQNGNGSIRVKSGYQISVVGGASIQKPQLLSPGVVIGAGPMSYPPPFFMPKVGCGAKMAEISEDGSTMGPGNWDEEFPPEGVTHLQSGVYCLNDGFTINGSLEGSGVLFKVEHGEVRFNGEVVINLSAPKSGEFAGLLIYLPMENNSKVVLNAGSGSDIKGTILAPASPILIKGNYSKQGFHSQIIGYTIEADGNSNVVIVYNDEQNFDSMTMPEVQLSE
jgi:Flp pilus assembly protein TadG